MKVQLHQFVDPSELHSGDKLIGLTRMSHNRMHEFRLEVLSIRSSRPQSSLIWAIIKDELLEETGVLAGMSGSPVYLGGKLVGAIAYTESFLKKPVVGITPIKEMIEIKKHRLKEINSELDSSYSPLSLGRYRLPHDPFNSNEKVASTELRNWSTTDYYRLLKERVIPEKTRSKRTSSRTYSFGKAPWSSFPDGLFPLGFLLAPPISDGFSGGVGGRLGRGISVISDSRNFFSGRTLKVGENRLESLGRRSGSPIFWNMLPVFSASIGGGLGLSTNSSPTLKTAKLVPGDLVGINLVRGDLDWSGYGTVTYISNDYFWAFGHPMSGAGVSRLPVYSARTDAVVPSQLLSYKIGRLGEEIGLLTQDRYSAILIESGKKANYIPIRVSLESPINQRTFNFEVVEDRNYFISLADNVLVQSLSLYENKDATFEYQFKISTGVGQDIEMRNFLSNPNYNFGENLNSFRLNLGEILAILEYNKFKRVGIKKIEIKAKLHPQPRIRYVDDIRIYQKFYHPGNKIRLGLVFTDHHKKKITKTFYFKLPKRMEEGTYQINIGSEQQRILESLAYLWQAGGGVFDLDEMLRLLNLQGRSNYLNIWMSKPEETLRVRKHFYRDLPANQARFMEGSLVGRKTIFRDLLFQEKKMDYFIVGSASAEVGVRNEF